MPPQDWIGSCGSCGMVFATQAPNCRFKLMCMLPSDLDHLHVPFVFFGGWNSLPSLEDISWIPAHPYKGFISREKDISFERSFTTRNNHVTLRGSAHVHRSILHPAFLSTMHLSSSRDILSRDGFHRSIRFVGNYESYESIRRRSKEHRNKIRNPNTKDTSSLRFFLP